MESPRVGSSRSLLQHLNKFTACAVHSFRHFPKVSFVSRSISAMVRLNILYGLKGISGAPLGPYMCRSNPCQSCLLSLNLACCGVQLDVIAGPVFDAHDPVLLGFPERA